MVRPCAPQTGVFHFIQLKAFTDDNWLTLCQQVTAVHRFIRLLRDPPSSNQPPVTICNGADLTPLQYDDSVIGLGVIVFNGDYHSNLSGDAFVLQQRLTPTSRGVCDTKGYPYAFLVMAVLLLAHHLCPDSWLIRSTMPRSNWQSVADVVNTQLGLSLSLPAGWAS